MSGMTDIMLANFSEEYVRYNETKKFCYEDFFDNYIDKIVIDKHSAIKKVKKINIADYMNRI